MSVNDPIVHAKDTASCPNFLGVSGGYYGVEGTRGIGGIRI